jgi:hypothetical protein
VAKADHKTANVKLRTIIDCLRSDRPTLVKEETGMRWACINECCKQLSLYSAIVSSPRGQWGPHNDDSSYLTLHLPLGSLHDTPYCACNTLRCLVYALVQDSPCFRPPT